jgi:predicted acyltransferase
VSTLLKETIDDPIEVPDMSEPPAFLRLAPEAEEPPHSDGHRSAAPDVEEYGPPVPDVSETDTTESDWAEGTISEAEIIEASETSGVLEDTPPETPPVTETPKPTPNRLLSLDAFRGLTILGMLLVNNVALDRRTPKQMLHADWSGAVHLADLVFPWFLLIVGVAIPYAAASRKTRGESYWRFVPKVFGRAITLVLLGCLIDSSAQHKPVFDLNVLQLIGLAYFVGALIYPIPPLLRGIVAAALLGAHWYILKHLPQPGAATGTFNEAQNAIIYLNQTYLSRWHLSGLVSVIPASAMVLIGTGIGDLLRLEAMRPWRKFAALCATGVVLLGLGLLWSHSIPFNKPLWSPSFMLYTAGWGALALAGFYAILDMFRWRWWAMPLLVFGSNAIFAYVAPILVKFYILQGWTWPGPGGKPWPLQTALLHASIVHWGPFHGGLVYTLGYVLVWWVVLFVLYRRGIFLRV